MDGFGLRDRTEKRLERRAWHVPLTVTIYVGLPGSTR